ncbi:hypothetical protein ECEC4402_5992 [Escherichia coli EC4402]|nr:hypothetical protein ECEC4402_5992 [Escherichia coli EC4402]
MRSGLASIPVPVMRLIFPRELLLPTVTFREVSRLDFTWGLCF